MTELKVDILIIGGGLVGALLLHSLKLTNLNCLLVERGDLSNKITADFDARSLALSTASIRILKSLNVWSLLEKNASIIDKIHVSEKGRFGNTLLKNATDEYLGAVVEMQHLNKALYETINFNNILTNAELKTLDAKNNIVLIKTPEKTLSIQAKLIVAADGTDSIVRDFCNLKPEIKDYNQFALVANIGLTREHKNIAYERFTKSGPLALLPMTGDRASLVWSLSEKDAQTQIQVNDHDFLKNLQNTFGYRLGKFTKVGKRVIFPLRQVTMQKTHIKNIVFIGNAAHTLHPVAGQGFNLGLRDVATLTQTIIQNGLETGMLENYQTLRRHDQSSIKLLTESLVKIFTNKFPGLGLLRGLGLITVDNSNLLKNVIATYARGFAGNIPDLVCKIPTYQRDSNEK